MSYYLFITLAIAIIAILYVWYMTRGINSIPDATTLLLNTTDNYLLADWYKHYLKPSLVFDVNENEVAVRLLQRLYNIQVDQNLIVTGNNIGSQYHTLTNRQISNDVTNTNIDTIYDIRSAIGVNTDIALIHNERLRNTLRRNNTSDFSSEILPIMESELEIVAKDYLDQVLKYRWGKIIELNDDRVTNNNDSKIAMGLYDTFLYLRECNIPNIESATTPMGFRINLLCGDLEFETLIKRWKSVLEPQFDSRTLTY